MGDIMTKREKVLWAMARIQNRIEHGDNRALSLLYTGKSKRKGFLPIYDPNRTANYIITEFAVCSNLKENTIMRYRQEFENGVRELERKERVRKHLESLENKQ
jgi:hypothetical protein